MNKVTEEAIDPPLTTVVEGITLTAPAPDPRPRGSPPTFESRRCGRWRILACNLFAEKRNLGGWKAWNWLEKDRLEFLDSLARCIGRGSKTWWVNSK